MAIPVIVIQTNSSGFFCTCDKLVKSGLEKNKDFVAFDDEVEEHPELIDEQLEAGEQQLLVTGTLHGRQEELVTLIRRWRAKNPQLKVWFSSSLWANDDTLFDRVVERPKDVRADRYVDLASQVCKFLGR